jgi:hypothetical protein
LPPVHWVYGSGTHIWLILPPEGEDEEVDIFEQVPVLEAVCFPDSVDCELRFSAQASVIP